MTTMTLYLNNLITNIYTNPLSELIIENGHVVEDEDVTIITFIICIIASAIICGLMTGLFEKYTTPVGTTFIIIASVLICVLIFSIGFKIEDNIVSKKDILYQKSITVISSDEQSMRYGITDIKMIMDSENNKQYKCLVTDKNNTTRHLSIPYENTKVVKNDTSYITYRQTNKTFADNSEKTTIDNVTVYLTDDMSEKITTPSYDTTEESNERPNRFIIVLLFIVMMVIMELILKAWLSHP